MQVVEIEVDPLELKQKMEEMRLWLDQHRFEPSTFICREEKTAIKLSVMFTVTDEAAAFAERFAGRVTANAIRAD